MFPLRDTVRSRTLPLVTWGLIALNILVFFYESALTENQFNQFVNVFGLVPARLSISTLQLFPWLTLITSIFLHGSWFHVISNVWFLFIFGDNVEDRMGPGRFLVPGYRRSVRAAPSPACWAHTSSSTRGPG